MRCENDYRVSLNEIFAAWKCSGVIDVQVWVELLCFLCLLVRFTVESPDHICCGVTDIRNASVEDMLGPFANPLISVCHELGFGGVRGGGVQRGRWHVCMCPLCHGRLPMTAPCNCLHAVEPLGDDGRPLSFSNGGLGAAEAPQYQGASSGEPSLVHFMSW